jgi:hypothetical protein
LVTVGQLPVCVRYWAGKRHSRAAAMLSANCLILIERQFFQVDQREAFYSAIPESHERDRNIPRNCKTHFDASSLPPP